MNATKSENTDENTTGFKNPNKQYLGNYVYVEKDYGDCVVITTKNGSTCSQDFNTILLVPEVLKAFLKWVVDNNIGNS